MTDTTEAGSGAQEGDAGDGAEPEPGGGEPPYDPLKHYDPEREFKYIETERAKVDQRLLEMTSSFATGVILMVRLSAMAIVWAAAAVPFLQAVSWFGAKPGPIWHGLAILGVPVLALLYVAGWLIFRLPIKYKWTALHIEMYLDDEVSNLLIRDREASRGELKGIHIDSNKALLTLLRLRMKAFHFWHRISIHTFILNGAFFRRLLETPLGAPRLWANGVPVLALAVFLSFQAGLLIGRGRISGSVAQIAATYARQVAAAVTAPRLGGEAGGLPAAFFMALGLALAILAYWLSRRARYWVTARLDTFLNTESFLTPHTHDSSREILAKHERLLRSLARAMSWRGGTGGQGGHGLGDLMLNEERDDSG